MTLQLSVSRSNTFEESVSSCEIHYELEAGRQNSRNSFQTRPQCFDSFVAQEGD